MIRIYKDKDIKVVTMGAYDSFYKALGYNIVVEETHSELPKKDKVVVDVETSTNTTDTVTLKKGASRKSKKED